MTLLSPWSLVWLGAVAAIIVLYLLKPHSRRLEVSSVWLWSGVLHEESARRFIRWLKRHLLLMLQIAIALVGVFLLARPALTRAMPVGRTVVFAVDASEAMLANDGDPQVVPQAVVRASPNGVSRLEEAKARTAQLVGQLENGDRVVVMAMADNTQVAAQGTLPQDRQALLNGIRRIQVRPVELDVQHALTVASSYTQSARLGEIILVTGGVYDPSNVTYKPPVAIQVARVGTGNAENQAITALTARRDGRGDLEVFARVRNFGDQDATGTLRLTVDGQLVHALSITVPAHQNWESVFNEFPQSTSVVQATFGNNDALVLDNVATTAADTPVATKVLLVGSRSDQLERALRAAPGVELTKETTQQYQTEQQNIGLLAPSAQHDVYVFDGWFPPVAPPGHWLLIDPPATTNALVVSGTLGRRSLGNSKETNDAQITRILPSPLLDRVDLTGVGVTEAKKVKLPAWAEEVVDAPDAPLIFMGYPQPYRAVVFAFDLRSSNLFGRVGFPILMANTLSWLAGEVSASQAVGASAPTFVPGEALFVQPLPRTTRLTIETPSKRSYTFDGNAPVRFLDTLLPGAYTIKQFHGGDQIAQRIYIGAVLQPGRENVLGDLRPRPELAQLNTLSGPGQQTILLGPGAEPWRQEWWRPLGALMLGLLVVEWWWFHR